ncbi:MAG TPA: aquaporin [Anaerolineales bacterium]|nr:aquaporin [Anaerolineales bacterium]
MTTKQFTAELIGTFTLVFVGAGAGALGEAGLVGVALAHGLALLAMVYVFGKISGAHINPAVTFGLALAGAIEWSKAIVYWAAQLIGGALAAAVLLFVLGGSESGLGATVLSEGVTPVQGIVLEAVLTFFLVTTVLHAAVDGKAGDFAGVAIGLTLAFAILMGGPLTGASLNPARTFGPALFTGTLDQFWIYLVGTFTGAAAATAAFKAIKG